MCYHIWICQSPLFKMYNLVHVFRGYNLAFLLIFAVHGCGLGVIQIEESKKEKSYKKHGCDKWRVYRDHPPRCNASWMHVWMWLYCINFMLRYILLWMRVCFYCLSPFLCTKPRDWLGKTLPKWPVLNIVCRVGRKTLTHSLLILISLLFYFLTYLLPDFSTLSQKTTPIWLAISLTYINGFW